MQLEQVRNEPVTIKKKIQIYQINITLQIVINY